jgi:uncharacterized protein (TIGR00730 family)
MNICVFCSSSNAVDSEYFNQAKLTGELIGKNKHQLIYGGANVGLMEELAASVKKNGGKIIGIIPEKIHQKELSSAHPHELIVTQTMDERKSLMRQKADAFIALPGGFGTLEEILEVITLKQLDYHRKPIIFVNTKGFFDNLLMHFEKTFEEHFAKESYRMLYEIAENAADAYHKIINYSELSPENKWFLVPTKNKIK